MIAISHIQITKISQIISQLRPCPRCCYYLYHSCYSLILSMQLKPYQLLLFIAWDGTVRFDGQLFPRPLWFGLIYPIPWISIIYYFLYFYLKKHSTVFGKPVLFPVFVSKKARYLDCHLLIRSEFVHRKKKSLLSRPITKMQWIFVWSF